MNIFEFAIEREVYMHKLYKELAQKASTEGFKNIFEMMAKEEGKHIEAFAAKSEAISLKEIENYFVEAKNIFQDLKDKKEVFESEKDQLMLYCKIRDMEEENEKFYLQEAQKTENEKIKKMFLEFAQEEKAHSELMEEIVQFVGRPLTWVSHAEMSSLRVY